MTTTNPAALTVWPVFHVDFNKLRHGCVWRTITATEVSMWSLQVGRRVIVEDPDEDDMRFYGTVTSLKPAPRAPRRWVMEVDFDDRVPQ